MAVRYNPSNVSINYNHSLHFSGHIYSILTNANRLCAHRVATLFDCKEYDQRMTFHCYVLEMRYKVSDNEPHQRTTEFVSYK